MIGGGNTMVKKEKGTRLFWVVLLFFLMIAAGVVLGVLWVKAPPELKDKVRFWDGDSVNVNQTVFVNQTFIENTTVVHESAWSGVVGFIIGALIVVIVLLIIYFKLRGKSVLFKNSPEKCREIAFQKLKDSQSNIRFEDGHGTWHPPICWNVADDVRSSRVACFFSTKKLDENASFEFNKDSVWLVDCSQVDPKNKFFPKRGVTPEKWGVVTRVLMNVYGRLDSFKVNTEAELLAQEFVQTGQLEGLKEIGKEGVTG